MNKQSTIRVVIFSAWIGFWGLSSVALLVAPFLQKTLAQDEVLPSIATIASIWLPVVSCFAGFWFNQSERTKAPSRTLSAEQAYGALALSFAYLLFVLVLICWSAYGFDYNAPANGTLGELPKGASFKEHLDQAVKMSLWISPLATAPVLALTGGSIKAKK